MLPELLTIASAAKTLFGGGEGRDAKRFQNEIGKMMMQAYKENRELMGPFTRNLSSALGNRQSQTLPLERLSLGRRVNPFSPGNLDSQNRPLRTSSRLGLGTGPQNGDQQLGSALNSFMSRRAMRPPSSGNGAGNGVGNGVGAKLAMGNAIGNNSSLINALRALLGGGAI
mgnify:CR=1 FL=1|tara:strand:- start:78 stop:587 length:510 start_codon:yes stop_codon:yes gene_type:complete